MTEALRLGTHLKVSRGIYSHHGIYVGNGNVVHYSGFAEMFKKGKIELTSIDDFIGDAKDLYRVKYSTHCEVFSDDEICERALSRLNENNYSLITNNCEHFATWCVTGVERSEQVEAVKEMTTTVVVSVNVIKALHLLYVSTAVSAPVVFAGGMTVPTVMGTSTIVGSSTTTALVSSVGAVAVASTATTTGIAAGGATAAGIAGAAVGGTTAVGIAAVAGGGSAAAGGAAVVGLVGGVAAAPLIAPIAVGAAIGAGVAVLWSWWND